MKKRSRENVKDTVRVYDAEKDLETRFSPRKGEKLHHISGGQEQEERHNPGAGALKSSCRVATTGRRSERERKRKTGTRTSIQGTAPESVGSKTKSQTTMPKISSRE